MTATLNNLGGLDATDVVERMINITKEVQQSMIPKTQFLKLEAKYGKILDKIDDIKELKEREYQQSTDDHFDLV